MLRYIYPLMFTYVIILFPASLFADTYILSNIDGNRFYSIIPDNRLIMTPKWNPNKELRPPLNINIAFITAKNIQKQLVRDSKHFRWELTSIKIKQGVRNHWFWVIEYKERPRPGITLQGPSGILSIAVLMDGSVIIPETKLP